VTPEWVAANDPLHAEWDKAWELETEHYHIRTDAGYRVLKDGGARHGAGAGLLPPVPPVQGQGREDPVADVWLFKDRASSPSSAIRRPTGPAGYGTGSQVITYDQRANRNQGSLRDTLEVLFHEASHQFTTLAGGYGRAGLAQRGHGLVLRGHAAALERQARTGTWSVPGALYPLAEDLRKPDRHKLADVIQGKVEDYRVNYPWGWGICYYLYNAEDPSRAPAVRPLMAEYLRQVRGRAARRAPSHEFFVTRAKVPGRCDARAVGERLHRLT
jgi:hypothetical protein